MNSLRVPMIVLAVVYALLAAGGLAISTFADGGVWWERVPMVLHLLAAVLLLWLVLTPGYAPRLATYAVVVMVASIAGSISLSVSITAGLSRGDWWLPLILAVIPAIGSLYAWFCRGAFTVNASAGHKG